MNEKTTDLEVIRQRPRLFTWGPVQKFHEIGDIVIAEHTRKGGERAFHVYVYGKDTHNTTTSLDGAIVLGLARKYGDERAAFYACKMLGIP